jgi:Amt family ammonium transporter
MGPVAMHPDLTRRESTLDTITCAVRSQPALSQEISPCNMHVHDNLHIRDSRMDEKPVELEVLSGRGQARISIIA